MERSAGLGLDGVKCISRVVEDALTDYEKDRDLWASDCIRVISCVICNSLSGYTQPSFPAHTLPALSSFQ